MVESRHYSLRVSSPIPLLRLRTPHARTRRLGRVWNDRASEQDPPEHLQAQKAARQNDPVDYQARPARRVGRRRHSVPAGGARRVKRYEVRWMLDSTYQVIDRTDGEVCFQGSIADCEAWIRLNEEGRM